MNDWTQRFASATEAPITDDDRLLAYRIDDDPLLHHGGDSMSWMGMGTCLHLYWGHDWPPGRQGWQVMDEQSYPSAREALTAWRDYLRSLDDPCAAALEGLLSAAKGRLYEGGEQ